MNRRNDFTRSPGFWLILLLFISAACTIVLATSPPLLVSLALGIVASAAARLVWMAVAS